MAFVAHQQQVLTYQIDLLLDCFLWPTFTDRFHQDFSLLWIKVKPIVISMTMWLVYRC